MQWQIDGSDEKTGESRSVKVAGKTREEAINRARAFGILASACVPIEISNADDRHPPPYTQLKTDASRVRFWAGIVGVLGIVIVVGGGVLLFVGFGAGHRVDPTMLASGAVCIVNGGVLLAISALRSE